MTTNYLHKTGIIQLNYKDGKLNYIMVLIEDILGWDYLKHDVQLYEEDLNHNDFKLIENDNEI